MSVGGHLGHGHGHGRGHHVGHGHDRASAHHDRAFAIGIALNLASGPPHGPRLEGNSVQAHV